MTDIKLFIKTDASRIRQLCIERQWYTCGNIEQYNRLLDYCNDGIEITETTLQHIADDIYYHSVIDLEYGYEDTIKAIKETIISKACLIFIGE